MEDALQYERRKLNSGIFFSTLKYGVNVVSAVGYSILMSRLFGADLVGMFFLLMTFIGVFNIVTNLGEQGGLVHIVNKYKQQDNGVPVLLLVFLMTSFLFTIILTLPFGAVAQFLLTQTYHKPELIPPFWVLTFSYLLFNNTSSVINNVYIAFQEMKYSLIQELCLAVIKIGGVFATCAIFSKSVEGIVALQVLLDVSQFVLMFLFLGRVIPLKFKLSREIFRQSVEDLKAVLLFGIRLMPKNYNYLVTEYLDRSILPMFIASMTMLGRYVIAYQVFSKVITFSAVFCKMLFPSFSRLSLQDNRSDMLSLYRDSLRKLLILMVFLVALGAGFSKGIMTLFGPDFIQADTVLMFLLPGLLAEAFSVTSATLVQALNRPGLVSIYSFMGALINGLLNVLLIPHLGIQGAAISNTGGLIIMAICFYAHGCKLAGESLLDVKEAIACLKLFGIGTVLFLASYTLQTLLPSFWLLPLWGALLGLLYLFLLHTLNLMDMSVPLNQLKERTTSWQRA